MKIEDMKVGTKICVRDGTFQVTAVTETSDGYQKSSEEYIDMTYLEIIHEGGAIYHGPTIRRKLNLVEFTDSTPQ